MFRPVSSQAPKVPVATFARTLSVERPSQAYSQSWIVPAPLVARWVIQPCSIIRSRIARRAVAEQVGAVDQHHAGAPLAGASGSVAAHSAIRSATAGGQGGGGASGSIRMSSARVRLCALGEREDLEPVECPEAWCS